MPPINPHRLCCRHTNTEVHQQSNLSTAPCIPAFLACRCVFPNVHSFPATYTTPPTSQFSSSWPVCWNGRIWFSATEWAPLCGAIDHCRSTKYSKYLKGYSSVSLFHGLTHHETVVYHNHFPLVLYCRALYDNSVFFNINPVFPCFCV